MNSQTLNNHALDTRTVGLQLVDLCNQNKEAQVLDELYSKDIVSVEAPTDAPDAGPQIMEGIDAIRGKHEWWYANNEIHSSVAQGPFVGDRENEFLVKFNMDLTPVGGSRMTLEELGIYTVSEGRIVKEEFFHVPA